MELLASVIRLRKRVAAFYSSDADTWRANSSHLKAIEILTDAYLALGKISETEKGVAMLSLEHAEDLVVPQERVSSEPKQPAENTKPALENEWLRDNPFINPKGRKKNNPSVAEAIFTLEECRFVEDDNVHSAVQESREADLLFAILCFFSDLTRLREYCNKVWEKVEPSGDISRLAGSFVTTEAINIAKQLECEVCTSFLQPNR
jgi:hypothetical protein